MTMRSLGATAPPRPNAEAGTTIGASRTAPAVAAVLRNSRRVGFVEAGPLARGLGSAMASVPYSRQNMPFAPADGMQCRPRDRAIPENPSAELPRDACFSRFFAPFPADSV
jgi:hypothetical protein